MPFALSIPGYKLPSRAQLRLWLGGRPKQQLATALRSLSEAIGPTSFCQPSVLAVKDVAVDARLKAVLIVGEGIEVEV